MLSLEFFVQPLPLSLPVYASLVHAPLLLLDLLDDEQRRIEEPVHTILETRSFSSAEFRPDRTGDAANGMQ